MGCGCGRDVGEGVMGRRREVRCEVRGKGRSNGIWR